MTKVKEPRYRNIPVRPEVYEKVKLVSEASGFGERGMGATVDLLVSQELPECEHEKIPVEIEYFGDDTVLPGELRKRKGFYCTTCKRVYEKMRG